MNSSIMRNTASFLLLVWSSSCASTSHDTARLPLHAALLPLGVRQGAVDPEQADVPLYVDAGVASERLARELGEWCFERVTLLSMPTLQSGAVEASSPSETLDEYWLASAVAAEADVVIEGELFHADGWAGASNDKFWLNLPIYLLAGPLSYFVNDRSYMGAARIQLQIHDIQALANGAATFDNGNARVLDVEARFERLDLDFIDRAGTRAGSYFASIIIPVGLLAHSGRRVEELLSEEVLTGLLGELVGQVQEGSVRIRRSDNVADFYVDEGLELAEVEGRTRLRGAAVLRVGSTPRLSLLVVHHEDRSVTHEFDESFTDEQLSGSRTEYLRYPFDVDLGPSSDNAGCGLRLELISGGRDSRARTFTLSGAEDRSHQVR